MNDEEQFDEFRLLIDLSMIYKESVANKVIKGLRKLNNPDILLSGDNSGLRNLWDEICVQIQGEYSIHWDAYENTIDEFIWDELQKLHPAVKKTLEYMGSISQDIPWQDMGPYCAIYEVREQVLLEAGSFSNKRIENYLDNMLALD
jgi:hypothetical protein